MEESNGKGRQGKARTVTEGGGEKEGGGARGGNRSGEPPRGQAQGASSGAHPPQGGPPSWQRSLDRLQVKHRQQFGRDPNFLMRVSPGGRIGTVTGNPGAERKDPRNDPRNGQGIVQRGNGAEAHRTGNAQFGFGYRRQPVQHAPGQRTPGSNGSRIGGNGQQRPTNIRTGSLPRSGKASLEGSLSASESLSSERQRSPRSSESHYMRTSDKSPRGEGTGGRSSKVTSPGKLDGSGIQSPGEGLRYGSLKRSQIKTHGQIARHIMQELKSGSSSGQIDAKSKSQALKNLFGRGTRDSGIEDTIITNPHAQFCKDNTVLDMSNRHGTMSDSEHSMSYITSPQSMRRRSQNASLNDSLLKTSPFSDSPPRYSGYVSDGYASINIGGISSLHTAGINSPYLRSNNNRANATSMKQSDSMESIESNTSSAMSISSHAASERYGPTQPHPSASVMRSNSTRSAFSEKSHRTNQGLTEKDLEDMAWLRAGNFGLLSGEKSGQISPTGSTVSQPPIGYFPAASSAISSTTSMVRSNSMSANAFTQPFTNRGRNGSVSLDERQRAALSMSGLSNDGAEELNGSSLSLVSTSSSLYSTAEDRAAVEIRRLKRELEREQGRVGNLSSQLNNNVSQIQCFPSFYPISCSMCLPFDQSHHIDTFSVCNLYFLSELCVGVCGRMCCFLI
ncbi:neuron navigator 2-like [Strongylocentrotus purpuratus]|uniref:Neuron navigator 2 n=1 Tax=Strongylocentrotus purpuratus TaxID=7668 RepID=A0A7M7T018_STRPU|nr:neuron navigator 2-like [Strongylocentrotus purpuratus]